MHRHRQTRELLLHSRNTTILSRRTITASRASTVTTTSSALKPPSPCRATIKCDSQVAQSNPRPSSPPSFSHHCRIINHRASINASAPRQRHDFCHHLQPNLQEEAIANPKSRLPLPSGIAPATRAATWQALIGRVLP
ncbi:hypothetical protein LR48_Vigan11g137500 [Vigna angularis]|uniref:Uncharacterized protein n=1 Tax=Phaseolus angularis TaxID=3914 RepID=A0A0L9VTC7_PHAAN|nr:hypothetical protein LR48_Vigan11g137500 [Vigna angularis]